jgi:hypothetical protein
MIYITNSILRYEILIQNFIIIAAWKIDMANRLTREISTDPGQRLYLISSPCSESTAASSIAWPFYCIDCIY